MPATFRKTKFTGREGLLAGGNWIVDKIKFVDTYPQQDALANIGQESMSNGGSPFNVLLNLAKLGASFPLAGVGLIGKDAEGDWISEQCAAHGVDARALRRHPAARTSYTDVMVVRQTGRRTFFHHRGANAFLDDGHFDFGARRNRIFHLGYLLLLDKLDQPDKRDGSVAARVLRRAKQAGLKTSVDIVSEDSQRFVEIVRPALRYVDYCFLNEFELERTTGVKIQRENGLDFVALKKAMQALLRAGVNEWVIAHFPDGVCALGREGAFVAQGSVRLPAKEIVSATGAGDALAAGVLLGLHDGEEIGASLRFGVCAAAACLRGAGTSDGLKSLEDCLQIAETHGFRDVLVD